MQYMGGKGKIARRVVDAILADTSERAVWFEPFVGGGNVLEKAAPHFSKSVAMDAHPDLIMMWQAVAEGFDPPEFVSRETYNSLRRAEPSAKRGFVGFGASFGGKWFGGYGVSPRDGEVCRQSYRTVVRQARVIRANDVRFVHATFGAYEPPPGTVVYCDPPYAGTTKYSVSDFDYEYFYATLGRWALTCPVYVSEYSIPEYVGADVIWSREKRNILEKADNARVVTEHLFRIAC